MGGIRFDWLNSHNSIVVLGQFGYSNADGYRERIIPSDEWRSIDVPHMQIIYDGFTVKRTQKSDMYVICLQELGLIQGYLIVEHSDSEAETVKHPTTEAIEEMRVPNALTNLFAEQGVQPRMS